MTILVTDLFDLHQAILDQELATMPEDSPRRYLSVPQLLGLIRMVVTPSFLLQLEQLRPGSLSQLRTLLDAWRATHVADQA